MTKPKLRQARRGVAITCIVSLASALGAQAPATAAPATGQSAATPSYATWFAPYVDATLPPMYPLADETENPAGQDVLGFVVAGGATTCMPSWGTYYSLAQANDAPLSLGTVIAQMRSEGKQPIVSFGGEDNTPLADACASASALAGAYQDVISRYDLSTVDFDIEGAAMGDTAGLERQAAAIRQVQSAAASAGSNLGVWLTVPVGTQGLLEDGLNVVATMLAGGDRLSGVNLMTMYFSPSPGDGAPMLDAVEQALDAAHAQLTVLFGEAGITLSPQQVWQHMGATVQIGQAGVPDQAFSVADAGGLVAFAQDNHIGRVSMWSINQDQPCGSASSPTVGGYSNYCSGVVQAPLAFDDAFSALSGTASSTPLIGSGPPTPASTSSSVAPPTTTVPTTTVPTTTVPTTTVPTTTVPTTTVPVELGSYAPWSPEAPYAAGWRVSYDGVVYQAKWWNRGEQPSIDVAEPWSTPWEELGAVAPGATGTSPPTVPAGTYPAWSATTVYTAGDRVLYDGLPYEDKWWNEGNVPSEAVDHPFSSPWAPLYPVPGAPVPTTTTGASS